MQAHASEERPYLFVLGTRPEAIKMAPVIKVMQKRKMDALVCVTAQHREMLDQVLDFFHIVPDYDLNLMRPNQGLSTLTSTALTALDQVFTEVNPSLVLVQGDTTTAFVGALAAFYAQCPVAHIEAGLRSGNKHAPYPEEINRVLTSRLADYHFAPTSRAVQALKQEGLTEQVYLVGNTVIDALGLSLDTIQKTGEISYYQQFHFLDFNKKIVLNTTHRRESFGEPLKHICQSIKMLASRYPDIQFVFPVHFNPNVREIVYAYLSDISNVFLIDPLAYASMVWLMSKAYVILTDSGGIQEEAPSLGKPVLVTREITERMEGIEAGTAQLVGTSVKAIIQATSALLDDCDCYQRMADAVNPYGDGHSAELILDILQDKEKK